MARIPEIIRRNPLSQVAPQAPKAGQGWAALADLAATGAEFVKPAAKEQSKLAGEKSVYRDGSGNLKVDARSLYSGEMGAIQNQAAYASYLSQKSIDLTQTMSELSVKYEFDPAGFKGATDAYVKTLQSEKDIPEVLKGDVIRSVQEDAGRRFNGLHRSQIDRTYKAADTQTSTARDLLMDDYVSLYVEGDEEGAASKWAEIEQLSRTRANAPYIAETPAETEAMMRGAQGTAKAARLLRDLEDLKGADEISDEQRAGLQDVLKDPDISPGTRQKLYAATQGRLKSIDARGIVKSMTDDSYASMVVRAESGGRNDAKAATSSAYGPHQFLKGTWAGLVKRYKPEWAKGLSEGQVQAMRGDRNASTEMFAHFRQENQAVLTSNGMPVNPATEYMAHFFGASTAVKVLAAAPGAALSDVVSAETIKANPFLQGMTARDAQVWAGRKMTMKSSDMAAMSVQIDQIEDAELRKLASDSLNERISVRQNIEDAAASVFEERIATGDVSLTKQQIREDHDLATDDQVRLTSALDKVNKQADEMRAIVTRINDPDAVFDANDTDDRKAIDSVFDAAIGDSPAGSDVGVAAAAQIAKKTGIIPKKASSAIKSAVASNDPDVVGQALESLAALKELAGGSLASVTGEKGLQDMLSDFEFYGQFGDKAQAAQRMIDNRESPPKNVSKEAKDQAKKLKISDVTDRFDKSWFSDPKVGDSRAGAGAVPLIEEAQENEMMAEYGRLFQDAFVETGKFDLAQNRALDQMDRIYGINEVSGQGRVMKFPPSKVYPAINGSQEWMSEQLVEEVSAAMFGDDVTAPGDGPAAALNAMSPNSPNKNWLKPGQIALVSDAVTARNVKSGKPASYIVYAMRDGNLELMPQRFSFDPAPAKAAARLKFEQGRAGAMSDQAVRDERKSTQQELTGGILDRFDNKE